ncbi:MAG: peptidase M14 [Armatimonadetes bacterium]|nr:peptidase M14 [Armatimonadota bacterium]
MRLPKIQSAPLSVVLFLLVSSWAAAQGIPAPEEVIGHRVGADYRLAGWSTMLDYYRRLEKASDRVNVRTIGRTTEGREQVVVEISSADTIRNLDRHFGYLEKIHDPRKIRSDADERLVLENAKTAILVNLSMHSTEVAAAQMGMELAYELVSRNDEDTREILDNCIVLLVACANPDGLDKVKDWYDRNLGTEYESARMPWLYQKYIGHDNNRDWWLVSQKETQNVSRYLYQVAFPAIVYDVHQMGGSGARFFVPPFHDPVNPNIDPVVSQGIFLIGAHMAAALAAEGKQGVLWGAIYDNWWQGGMRTTPQRHNIVAVLTEAASARLASPTNVAWDQLRGSRRGLPSYDIYVNFPDPWPGGAWTLRDIVEYEKTACYSLFRLGARYREMWVTNQLALSKKQLRLGREEAPFGWLIPPDQKDPGAVHQLLKSLMLTGIEAYRARAEFEADERIYPAGTIVLPAAQPYRAHLKDMMEAQEYPHRFEYPGGPAETPYDVAGWTAPLQMGVNAIEVENPFTADLERLSEPPRPNAQPVEEVYSYVSLNRRNDDILALFRLGREGFNIAYIYEDKEDAARGSLLVHKRDKTDGELRAAVQQVHVETFAEFRPHGKYLGSGGQRISVPRIALYQPWMGNMDEGWTRFVWEERGVEYTTLHNAGIRAGGLRDKFDCIFFASQGASSILNGSRRTLPEYAGGIGDEGLEAIKEFVEAGGTLVLMDSACSLAERLELPVRNVLSGLGRDKFYCPGSILRTTVDTSHPLGWGFDEESIAYFASSRAFEVEDTDEYAATVVVRYGEGQPLLSGFLLGEEHLAGKPAVVEFGVGKGRVVLFGFRVQYRGQSLATFKFMFNAMLRSVMAE